MFSIIIPVYNKAPYVAKAIQSVLDQTYQEFELIVVDDGSTDNSLEVIKSLSLSTFNFQLSTQVNSGVSTARNNGVAQAKYDYICFLDADDWWAPDFLKEMKNLIEKYPDAGIYGTSYFKVKDKKNIKANIGVETNFTDGVINYCQVYAKTLWMPLTSISVAIPKNVFEKEKGFKPQLKLGEDFDLWIRIAMEYSVAFLNKPLAYYNQDVDIANRAVGARFYLPEEHMLFTDYGEWMENKDFKFLFERLALYGLLPYYLENKNKAEVNDILDKIDFEKHEKKYWWYYKALPKWIVKGWFEFKRLGSVVKNILKKLRY